MNDIVPNPATEPEKNELVTMEEEAGFLTSFQRNVTAAITTISGDTEESRMLRINCTAPAMKRLSLMVGAAGEGQSQVVEVEHFLLHAVKRTDEKTGEISIGPRCVLVTPKGETIVASSKAISELMCHAMNAFKEVPWRPPVRLECFRLRSANGFDYVAGRLLPREHPVKPDGKKK